METAVRLQKFLANQGIASRREIERMIEEGRIEIDGNTAQLGDKIVPGVNQVSVDGRVIRKQHIERMVLAINKPRGLLCSHSDPHHSETIFDLLPDELKAMKWIMIGRLDKESEGLVLMTNDGDFAHEISHPSYGMTKRYRVEINRPLDAVHIAKLLKGIEWKGERLQADKVIPLKNAKSEERGLAEVHLHHGRKHEIRNLFYAFGYRVRRLRRTQIGNFTLKGLPIGTVRVLSPAEIATLK
ncbi:MAG: rRNA pseudouridine synthase [Opitutales bacterium]|nr:rRNA pseudouridine synthase [Opitutales bacterium]